jgi:hypothetical protein
VVLGANQEDSRQIGAALVHGLLQERHKESMSEVTKRLRQMCDVLYRVDCFQLFNLCSWLKRPLSCLALHTEPILEQTTYFDFTDDVLRV